MSKSHNISLCKLCQEDAEQLYSVIEKHRHELANLVWTYDATLNSTRNYINAMNASDSTLKGIIVNSELVGCIILRPNGKADLIGYWIGPHRNEGIMSAAVHLVLTNHNRTVTAAVRTGNIASQKILMKNGFKVVKSRTNNEWIYFEHLP